jgi:hypothetical protein
VAVVADPVLLVDHSDPLEMVVPVVEEVVEVEEVQVFLELLLLTLLLYFLHHHGMDMEIMEDSQIPVLLTQVLAVVVLQLQVSRRLVNQQVVLVGLEDNIPNLPLHYL